MNEHERIDIPTVPPAKVTDDVLAKMRAVEQSIVNDDTRESENRIAAQYGMPAASQRRCKAEVRKALGMAPRTPLEELRRHPQLRDAITYVVVRDQRSDKGSLRSVRGLCVVIIETGETIGVEQFLLSVYARPKTNAFHAYVALKNLAATGKIFRESTEPGAELVKCTVDDLPAYGSVARWLSTKRKESIALRKSQMTKGEWDSANIYIKRNKDEYRVRGFIQGDHTELDVECIDTKTGKIVRYWASTFVDVRTGMGVGYCLTLTPNSESIGIAYRNSVLGTQLKIATPSPTGIIFKPIEGFVDAPDLIMIDNGKDYRSKQTETSFGKIDFNDEVRRTIQRLSEIRHAPPRDPKDKGNVERFFGVLNQYWKTLPGYTGSFYRDRPESLSHEKKNGELFTTDEFPELFDYAWNAYNNKPQRELNGLSRIQYALASSHIRRIVDERVLDLLLMKIAERRVRRGYISVNGIEYFSMQLQEHNNAVCSVYIDPQNVGFAHVYIDGVFVTTAIQRELVGTKNSDWAKFVKERKHANKEIAREIKELKQGITDIAAKRYKWNGMTGNVAVVDEKSLTVSGGVNILTGIERAAQEMKKNVEQAGVLVEVDRAARKRKTSDLSVAAINDRIS